jgi:hypothetical protein
VTEVANRDALEAELAKRYSKLSAGHRKELLTLLGNPPSYANVPQSFWARVAKDLDGSFMPFLSEIYMQQAETLLTGLPVGVDWAIINQRAAEWAKRHSYDLITGLTDNSRAVVQQAITNFFEQQMTRGDLETLIGRAFGPVRAEMIAVTEVTRAATEAEIQIGEELAKEGILMTAKWYTRNDEIVAECPVCYPLNERPADGYTGLRTPYWNSPTTNDHITPPAHPRCRCSMGWELPKK